MQKAYANYTDIEIDRNVICRQLGYSPDVEPSPRISAIINECVENAKHLISPSYFYVLKDIITVSHSSATIEGPIVFHSHVISELLQKSSKVAVFIATIGGDLEEVACKMADNAKIVQSYVLDAIGSCLADSMASYVEARIAKQALEIGLCISRRFSPGYCDWDIGQQEMVFRVLSQEVPDVTLSEGYFMTPQKSVSGIIGIAPPENCIVEYNPCKACNKHLCIGRR